MRNNSKITSEINKIQLSYRTFKIGSAAIVQEKSDLAATIHKLKQ